MTHETISKNNPTISPNLADYAKIRRDFTWEDAVEMFPGFAGEEVNIAREAVDRHVKEGRGDKTAILWLGEEGERVEISYGELFRQTNRFANILRELGVQSGERVFTLAERIPELYFAVLGALKHGCTASALFPAFGPEPAATRMELGDGRVLVTTEDQYETKVARIRDRLPGLKHVLIVGEDGETDIPDTKDMGRLMDAASDEYETAATPAEHPALLHFTSGTTGKPKGALHVHRAALAHGVTGRYVLDLHEDDVYWCTADPGWVTGVSYGIVAPLLNGVTMIVDQAEFDLERWYEIIQNEKVSVWYTAPTAIRMMMKAGEEAVRPYSFDQLRLIFSVGEPLNAEAVVWAQKAFGMPIHDTWWQTETGAIMIANFASRDIRPGSMGSPIPGIQAELVHRGEGGLEIIREADTEGEIALKTGWPSMFREYINDEERYDQCFADGYYLTGDLAKRDADDYFWFVGRADDIIKSSGHLIGPFEVESALMEHPAVAEAGVIGKPDPVAGQIVKAFLSLRAGHEASDALLDDIYGFGRKRLGTMAPRELQFMESLPKTRSGKVMRRLLKARELGLPEGDTSTLESGGS